MLEERYQNEHIFKHTRMNEKLMNFCCVEMLGSRKRCEPQISQDLSQCIDLLDGLLRMLLSLDHDSDIGVGP